MKSSKINLLDLFRWLVLIPASFLVSGLLAGFVLFFFLEYTPYFEKLNQKEDLFFALFCSLASVFYLTLCYTIAPKYKNKVLWLSYVCGSLVCLLVFFVLPLKHDLQSFLALLLPLVVGLLTSVVLYFGKSILNEIDR